MTKKNLWFGVPAIALVFAIMAVGCELTNSNESGGSGSGSASVPVTDVFLQTSTSLVVGGVETLIADIEPYDATNKNVTWRSSNTAVATVSTTGVVTGISAGTAIITVTTQDGGKTAYCTVTVSSTNVSVTGVALNKTSTTLSVGADETLFANIEPSNATNKSVTWRSNNTAVATVSTTGLVTGVSAGTTTITVTTADGNKSASCTVTVSSIAVTTVSLKASTSLLVGNTETLFAVVAPDNATNKKVTWKSNNTAVATVSTTGLVTAVSAGTADITVTTADGGKTASCPVTVSSTAVTVTRVTLNKTSTSIVVGNSESLSATIQPSTATNQSVTWSSGSPSVATVSEGGFVTGLNVGNAVITVTTEDGNKTASCTVTVIPVAVSGVTLNKSSASLSVGGTESLFAAITPSNAANQSVTWSSGNSSVATVSSTGVVTAVAAGTATITVKTDDGNKAATCIVTVTLAIPAVPTGVSATGASTTSITVSWSSVTGATGYKVYRSTSASGTYTSVGTSTSTLYTDSGLNANTTYYYKVSATNSAGESAQSAYSSASPLPPEPTFVAVTNISGVPTSGAVGSSLTLTGTVAPANATNQTIVWSVKSAGTTGAAISGSTLTATAAGSVTVTATIANGKTASTPYTQDFTITITGGGGSSQPFTTVAAFETWLKAQPGNTANTAYDVVLNLSSLGGSSGTSGSAGKTLRDNNTKYVSLDLSGSTFTSIGNNAFSDCRNLTGITIGNNVTSIGEWAFDTTSLTSVTIPNSVTSIGEKAFIYCKSLTVINVDTLNTVYSSQDGVFYNKGKTALYTYPAGKVASSFTIPNGVTSIEDQAFSGCTSLTSVTIPNSVTRIEGAFYSCDSLTEINVAQDNNTFTAENGVLYNKSKTTLIRYPEGKIGSFSIPNSVTSIGDFAFQRCSITSVAIPGSVTSIGRQAFQYCKFTSITIPNSVTRIGDAAFNTCDSLTSVTFEGTIASSNFSTYSSFDGDLRAKYLAGGIGTYKKASGTWTKQ